ncbi:MAG: 2-dehydropantoate 2-reductase [Candidatus Lokiarchaeota archaeon]|nr:2-dehydropantoate 2-reductase [Candidatus Lokiarchaeota archaeon]
MSKKKIRIGFIGAGSIGSLFGGYIANIESDLFELDVTFLCLGDHAAVINQDGLEIIKNQTVQKIHTIHAYENEKYLEECIEKDPTFRFDLIFLTTKTYDIENAISQYQKIIEVSNCIVLLQNGIGNEDVVSKHVVKSKIIRVVTTNGAFLKEPGKVIHTGEGLTKIGLAFAEYINLNEERKENSKKSLELLLDLLRLAGFETLIAESIIKESWEKVFVNVGINAFGALTRLKNGELLKFEGLKHLMGEAIKEAIEIAKLKEIMLTKKDFVALTYEVARKTAENKNSMLQDVLNGSPTEIDFINGRIVMYAHELGVKVPINEVITQLIKGLEASTD